MLSENELKRMMEVEDRTHSMAELAEILPKGFTAISLVVILSEMVTSKVTMEDDMRESLTKLAEASRTRLLDSLGASGYRDRPTI